MNTENISQELLDKIAPYKNEETGLYDIDAVREAQRAEQGPRRRYQGIFESPLGGNDDPLNLEGTMNNFFSDEHTMCSAAITLNEQVEQAAEENQASVVVKELLDGTIRKQGMFEDRNRIAKMSDEQKTILTKAMINVIDRPSSQHSDTTVFVHNTALNALLVTWINGTPMAVTGYNEHDVDITNARKLVAGESLSDEYPLFTRETEEYLASIGL